MATKSGASIMTQHHKINYIELPSKNIEATKRFYTDVFDWTFIDYGPEYCVIQDGGLNGGFYASNQSSATQSGGTLVVIYSKQLEETQSRVIAAGGSIVKEIFEFPGGRRFHFLDSTGNELAVWSTLV
jgi:uncharacterized protein